MASLSPPIIGVEQARRILGQAGASLSDAEIMELVDQYDRVAQVMMKVKMVRNPSKLKQ